MYLAGMRVNPGVGPKVHAWELKNRRDETIRIDIYMEYLHMSLEVHCARRDRRPDGSSAVKASEQHSQVFEKDGVILLDVKPENIMLSRSYYPYPIDFGGGGR